MAKIHFELCGEFAFLAVATCDVDALPEPLHGRLICTEYRDVQSCVTSCDADHVLNHVAEYREISCGKRGNWDGEFPPDFPAKACLSEL